MPHIYLLHFERPLQHARHYCGASRRVIARIREHRNGHGSHLTNALHEHNIPFVVTNVWQTDQPFASEHILKIQNNGPRYCPLCTTRIPTIRFATPLAASTIHDIDQKSKEPKPWQPPDPHHSPTQNTEF